MANRLFNVHDNYDVAVGLGLIAGHSFLNMYAVEANATPDLPIVIGTGLVNPPIPSDTGSLIEVVGVAGDVGQTVIIDGLNVDFEEQRVTLTLNGDTPVQVPGVCTRLNGATVSHARGDEPVGMITIRDAGDQTVYGTIDPSAGVMRQGIVTIPAGRKFVVMAIVGTMQKSTGVDTAVAITLDLGAVGQNFRQVAGIGLQRSGDTAIEFTNRGLTFTDAPTDVFIRGEADAAGATIAARVSILLVKR